MIELQNVTKKFEPAVTAVNNLSFTVQEGEIFGLIGTSGCGKTTTLKTINRLEEITSGSISINGQLIGEKSPEKLRRGIGYVIQNVGLFPHYTVAENIAITPKLLDWKQQKIESRSHELLQLVGLNPQEFSHRKPATLSGGQQQRIGLARALAADPPVILMDEPFGALDPITKERIQKEFKKLLQEIKKTVVLVTHDVFEAFDLCDRICLMNKGQAQQIGTPRELLFEPANAFVHSFFDNHRFQLEMMSITVGDILKDLGEASKALGSLGAGEGDGISVSFNDNFFSVFELIGDEHIIVSDKNGQQVARLATDDLLQGFQAVRRTLKERRND